MNDIDVVITWVNHNDKAWLENKKKYEKICNPYYEAKDISRFRDWENLQYVFRGIEKFAPWVRKIHFVTCGHLPEWLDTKNKKLKIVLHSDFMDSSYLPTFNSNSIELNIPKIKDLSEYYINFNDDMFLIKPLNEKDFFINGLPCDYTCVTPIQIDRDLATSLQINDLKIINDYFSVSDIKKDFLKWINPINLGFFAFRTLLFTNFRTIIGFYPHHLPQGYVRSTALRIWDKEFDELDKISRNKFRTMTDCNEWLFKMWQLCSNEFIMRKKMLGKTFLAHDIDMIKRTYRRKDIKMICVNDDKGIKDFENIKNQFNDYLNSLLPEKSSFEK